jgi:molecular chaperone GrpE (heat shock protein)
MLDQIQPKLSKWPFYLGDALLVGAAYFTYFQSKLPMGPWQIFFVVVCVAGGAWLAIMPFLLEYRVLVKLAEARALTTVMSQMQNLEGLTAQINSATGQWQYTQEQADKTAILARELAQRMSAEVQAFTKFMERANDSERATLRLELEKQRRGENDWLQVVVRMLDHVFALHQGALRSGQPNLIAQLASFQNACRDAARRVGLTPLVASDSEPFDGQRHQLIAEDAKPAKDALVAETVAAGYTFQGKLLRPVLVRLRDEPAGDAPPVDSLKSKAHGNQSQLPLEQPADSIPI